MDATPRSAASNRLSKCSRVLTRPMELIVPCDVTARIQEAHALLYHTICEVLDPILAAAQ